MVKKNRTTAKIKSLKKPTLKSMPTVKELPVGSHGTGIAGMPIPTRRTVNVPDKLAKYWDKMQNWDFDVFDFMLSF